MNVNDELNEKYGSLIETKFAIKDGDEIVLFFFDGSNECLQEIELENYEDDNSQFFIEELGEPVVIACYFYLAKDKNKLQEYLLKSPFHKWIIEDEKEYVEEILKRDLDIVKITPSKYDVKYSESNDNEYYGDMYKKIDTQYKKIDEEPEYDFGDDNFTAYLSINEMMKAIFITCKTSAEYEIIELGHDPIPKLKEMKIVDD